MHRAINAEKHITFINDAQDDHRVVTLYHDKIDAIEVLLLKPPPIVDDQGTTYHRHGLYLVGIRYSATNRIEFQDVLLPCRPDGMVSIKSYTKNV